MIRNPFFALLLLIGTLAAEEAKQSKGPEFFAKALYWYPSETMDWAYTIATTSDTVQLNYRNFVFHWAPGFSVGVGYPLKHDQWDTRASYTWFQSKASGQAGNGNITPGFLAARLSLLEPFATGQASMNIHYNMFDFTIGRKFSLTQYFRLRPSLGLKGGWINQTIHSDWTKPDVLGFIFVTASENLKQTFETGGPKGTVEGEWSFATLRNHTFSLLGAFEAGFLWGHWDITDQYVDNLATTVYLKTTQRNLASLMFRSYFGFGWDYDLNCKHIQLKLGYEIEDWLNQCQFFTNINGSQNNDLILQGFEASLDFSF